MVNAMAAEAGRAGNLEHTTDEIRLLIIWSQRRPLRQLSIAEMTFSIFNLLDAISERRRSAGPISPLCKFFHSAPDVDGDRIAVEFVRHFDDAFHQYPGRAVGDGFHDADNFDV